MSQRRGSARLVALAAAAALSLALATVPATPAGAALPDAESRMLGHLNGARSSNGLGSLSPHGDLTAIARGWAARMAADYEQGGDRRGALRHNPSMRHQLPSNYRRAGENVGYSVLTGASQAQLVDRLHDAYMQSSGHRANIMGEFDRVGVGLVQSDDGTMWSAVVFMLEGAQQPEPDPEPAEPAESGTSPSSSEGSSGGSSAATEARPDPEPVPDPPTAEELFGPDWPEGYLVGDADATTALLGLVRGSRTAGSLLALPWLAGGARPVHVASPTL